MNLMFLHPELLILAPVVAVGGWLLLRKANEPERIFTILEFWPEETAQNTGRQQRMPDWPWLLILAAAILAALALSSPQLQLPGPQPTAAQTLRFQAIGRSLPDNPNIVDVFVKASSLPNGIDYSLLIAAHRKIIRHTVSAKTLARGIDITPVPGAQTLTVALRQNGRTLAHVTLLRSSAVQKIKAHFIGAPPPAFLRLLSVTPSITFHGRISHRGLWIIHQRHFNVKILRGITDSTFVLLGDTPGPGLAPLSPLRLKPPQTPVVVSDGKLMRFVNTSRVVVKQMFTARFDSHWNVLMEVHGQPWLAQRDDMGTHITWLWLAGRADSTWNDWPHHASFVVFFANVITALQKLPGPLRQGRWWRSASVTPVGMRRPPPTTVNAPAISLNIPLAVIVCAGLLTAMLGLMRVNGNSR